MYNGLTSDLESKNADQGTKQKQYDDGKAVVPLAPAIEAMTEIYKNNKLP